MKRRKTLQTRAIADDVAFDLIAPDQHTLRAQSIFGCDHYKLWFSPPLKGEAHLKVTDLPSRRTDVCVSLTDGPHLIEGDYRVYETHALSVDGSHMYIALENTQMNGNSDEVRIFRPVFDWGIAYLERFERLSFVPPDKIDNVNAAIIPQHNPLWRKKKGKMTSSSVAKYLGFFVPDPESKWARDRKEAETWTLATKKDFSGWSGVRVRFGALKECEVVAAYLKYYKDRTFFETGYTVHPQKPDEWGAAPDGLVVDENGETRTVEIKASTANPEFDGYAYAQVVWEMACLDTQKGDLIKYCEKPGNDNITTTTCRVATIPRDLALEKRIQEMVSRTRLMGTKDFKEAVFSQEYRELCEELKQLAKDLKYVDVATSVEDMIQYRADRCMSQLPTKHPKLLELEQRQLELHCAFEGNRKDEVRRLVMEQIREYSNLLLNL